MDRSPASPSAPMTALLARWRPRSSWRAWPSSVPLHWMGGPGSRLWCHNRSPGSSNNRQHLVDGRRSDPARRREPSLLKVYTISVWRMDRSLGSPGLGGVHLLLTIFNRPRRRPYWVNECWKPAFSPSRFKYRIHVLARRGSVGDVPDSATPRSGSRKSGRSKILRFHFTVKLFLPGGIFTQNIFFTCLADSASKASSKAARERM